MQRLVRNAHNNWPKFSQNELDSLCKLCQQCPGFVIHPVDLVLQRTPGPLILLPYPVQSRAFAVMSDQPSAAEVS